MTRTPATDACFAAFRAVHPDVPDHYDVVAFGDTGGMADTLAALVLNGPKRATAGLLRDFEGPSAEPMPVVGGHVVMVDGNGKPRGIWRTTQVDIVPFDAVDAAFAWDEGEGDRTLEDWRDGHRRYWTRQAERQGFTFDETMPVVLERFRLVWPPEKADP